MANELSTSTDFTVVVIAMPQVAEAVKQTQQFRAVEAVGSTGGLRDLLRSGTMTPGARDKIFVFSDATPVDTPQSLEFLVRQMTAMEARVIIVATTPAGEELVAQIPSAGLVKGHIKVNTILGAINGMQINVRPVSADENVALDPSHDARPVAAAPQASASPFGSSPFVETPQPAATEPPAAPEAPPVQESSNPFAGQTPSPFAAPSAPPAPAEGQNNPFSSVQQPSGAPANDNPFANIAASTPSGENASANPFAAPTQEQPSSANPFAGSAASAPSAPTPFAAQEPAAASFPAPAQEAPASPFGNGTPQQVETNNPFAAPQAPPFGAAPAEPQSQPFGAPVAPANPNPFAAQAPAAAPTPFETQAPQAPSSFGAPPAGTALTPAPQVDLSQPAPASPFGAPMARPVARAGQEVDSEKPQRRGFVITVLSPKGGTGKSTVSLNLAAYLGLRTQGQRSVALIDANVQQADTGKYLGAVSPTVEDLGKDPTAIHPDRITNHMLHKPDMNLSILLGPLTPDVAFPVYYNGKKYAQILEAMRPSFDYIIIDTPVAEFYHDLFRQFALPCADFLLVLTAPNQATVTNTDQWLRSVCAPKQSGGMGIDSSTVGIVLNRAEEDIGFPETDVMRDLAEWRYLGAIPETREWKKANNEFKVVATMNYAELNEAFANVLYQATGDELLRTGPTNLKAGSGTEGLADKLRGIFKKRK